MDFRKTEFIKSAAAKDGFIRDRRPQLAFAGRSNVGKSSVINSLVQRKNYARVGAQPGKTTQINYFLVDNAVYLADLPGYGYAKVSAAEKQRWARLMESYFQEKSLVTLGVLIVDARHKPTKDDEVMAAFFIDSGTPLIVVGNKLDKLKKSEIEPNLALIRETLRLPCDTPLVPYSAEKGTGRGDLIAAIERALS